MEPTRRTSHLIIAVPASFTSDIPHIREKTSRVGIIARAAATFRVEEIIIYHDLPDQDQRTEEEFVATLLRYIETPQYLRKLLFPTSPLLQYAGVLPPLRTPHHPLERHSDKLKVGEFREGVVIARRNGGVAVEIGVEQPAILPQRLPNGTRVTVQVVRVSDGNIRVRLAELSEISIYWGYRVRDSNPTLGEITGKGFFDLVVLTSRLGKPLTEAVGDIKARWRDAQSALIVFGSPREGLDRILSREGLKADSVGDFDVNTIPLQGVETVRTDEAVWATLAALNIIIVD
jgi:predicted SPOUT superfamily RNA methylase MTH1